MSLGGAAGRGAVADLLDALRSGACPPGHPRRTAPSPALREAVFLRQRDAVAVLRHLAGSYRLWYTIAAKASAVTSIGVPGRASDAPAVLDRVTTAVEQSAGARDERAIGRARHLWLDEADAVEQRAKLPPAARGEQGDDPSQMLLGSRQLALVGRRQSERDAPTAVPGCGSCPTGRADEWRSPAPSGGRPARTADPTGRGRPGEIAAGHPGAVRAHVRAPAAPPPRAPPRRAWRASASRGSAAARIPRVPDPRYPEAHAGR